MVWSWRQDSPKKKSLKPMVPSHLQLVPTVKRRPTSKRWRKRSWWTGIQFVLPVVAGWNPILYSLAKHSLLGLFKQLNKRKIYLIFRFFDEAELDCEFCDQLVCIGTSLEVYPFAGTISWKYPQKYQLLFHWTLREQLLYLISIGIVDAPKHQTPRLLINYDLVISNYWSIMTW